jgi:hypothetical protein
MENKSEHIIQEFDIVFDKLAEAKNEQLINNNLTESDYSEINESVQILQEIQQNIESSTYTFFTRT